MNRAQMFLFWSRWTSSRARFARIFPNTREPEDRTRIMKPPCVCTRVYIIYIYIYIYIFSFMYIYIYINKVLSEQIIELAGKGSKCITGSTITPHLLVQFWDVKVIGFS